MSLPVIIVTILGVAFIGFILYSVFSPSPHKEKKLTDLEDDDLIYDPVTGTALTVDEAMENKGFMAANVSEEDLSSIYDEDAATAYVSERLPDDLKNTISEKEVEWVIRLQGQYLLTKPDTVYDVQNIDFIYTVLQNTPLRSLNKDDIKQVLEIEKQYQDTFKRTEETSGEQESA